jgi:beta-glucosidase
MLWRRVLPTVLSAFVSLTRQDAAAADWPWFNVTLPQEVRLKALVDAMTPAELVTQLVKYSQRIDRLGVPQYAWHMEAAHGIAAPGNESSFPCSLARAGAFDPEMEELIARATGEEARAKWNQYRLNNNGATPPYNSQGISLTTYAPEINVCSSP